MLSDSELERDSAQAPEHKVPIAAIPKSRGYWAETWLRFRRRKIAMIALAYVVLLILIALFSPMIAGTKPVICKYEGKTYFPCLAYYNARWEPGVFVGAPIYKEYAKNLKKADPDSWAIWPLVFQDPYNPVGNGEWPGLPANPVDEAGKPYLYYLSVKAYDSLFGTNYVAKQYESPPKVRNWLGTHQKGIDIFAQLVHGTKIALLVGFVSMSIASVIGVTLGAVSGYFGGVIDSVISRLTEVVLCVPKLVLILALLAVLEEPTIYHMMAVLGFTGWTGIARLMRAEFLKLKESDYVVAARSLGVGQVRIMFRHILPNALAPILVPIVFGIASAILIEAGLSLLGFGAPPPNPSWGNVLQSGKGNPEMWWVIVFPGLAIFFTVLAYNLIGEGVQEATDPRLREGAK